MDYQKQDQLRIVGIVQVMLAAMLWATVGVSTKLVASSGTIPHEMLGLARLAVGGTALFLLLAIFAPRSLSGVRRLDPALLVVFATGCATFQICLFQAFVLLGVTTTVFITVCLPPVLATGLSMLRGGSEVTMGGLSALGLAIVGLATFMMDGLRSSTDHLQIRGLFVAVLASLAFVMMTNAARRLTQTVGSGVVAATGLCLSALLLATTLPLLQTGDAMPTATASWELSWLIAYLGIGPTALAYVLYCSGMARCRSANLGLIASMVEPVCAALLAWILLSEWLSLAEAIGCALVMLAMLTLWASERLAPPKPLQLRSVAD